MNKLITYAFFKTETDIAENVDNDKLDNPIKKAQDRLRGLIGPTYYNELVSQVVTTPKSLTPANSAFFDPYVKQYLAWQAYEFYIVRSNVYETRTGLRVFKEDNSDPIDNSILGEMIAQSKRNCQEYKDQMINFLRSAQKANSLSYPLYTIKARGTTGSGFGISAISKIDTVNMKIDNSIVNQEPNGSDNIDLAINYNAPLI